MTRIVCWTLVTLSSYHAARLRAFALRFPGRTVALELADQGALPALERRDDDPFERRTCFPGRHWRAVPGPARARRLWSMLDAIGPDVVCVNGWSAGGGPAALAWALWRGRPAVLMSASNRHDRPRLALKEAIKRRIVRGCAAALAGGTGARAYLAALGMDPSRIFLGYDVVDNAHFAIGADAARAGGQGAPFFLAVARLVPEKNLDRLLLAYARYRRLAGAGAWGLALLGDGPLRGGLEALRLRLGLEAHVLMPGPIGYDELPAWYGRASALVHASIRDTWGLVVNEAMAAGLPVLVSSRCGCAVDLVADGINGLTFDPLDVDALARRMHRLAHGDLDRAAMGRASRALVAAWGPERFADGLLEAVATALAALPARPRLTDRLLLAALAHR